MRAEPVTATAKLEGKKSRVEIRVIKNREKLRLFVSGMSPEKAKGIVGYQGKKEK